VFACVKIGRHHETRDFDGNAELKMELFPQKNSTVCMLAAIKPIPLLSKRIREQWCHQDTVFEDTKGGFFFLGMLGTAFIFFGLLYAVMTCAG
jgi:hypothetical protein